MENASKALMMAGGILIALLIIGALTIMIVNLSDFENSEQQREQEGIIADFNNDYLYYDSKELTFMEAKSLYNKIISNNKKNLDNQIELVIVNNKSHGVNDVIEKYAITNQKTAQTIISIDSDDVAEEIKKLAKFECTEIKYDDNGYINYIEIEDISPKG